MWNGGMPVTYSFLIANADETYGVIGPKGKEGRLWDYGVFGVTTAFAGATTTPMMSVGTAADPDAYGEEFDFGALADNAAKSVRSTYDPNYQQSSFDDYVLAHGKLPADTLIQAKWIAATGGGAAGVGRAFMVIVWDP